MRVFVIFLLLGFAGGQTASSPQIPPNDAIRIREFYRVAPIIEDKIWPDWSKVAAPVLLVTQSDEFLTHHPDPPKVFTRVADDTYHRPRQFPTNLLATFPAFGPPSVIVIGEAENTEAKTSTHWVITLMHEHFHQLQDAQPGLFDALNKLGLARGDTTGMWMLNYPFPYDDAKINLSFAHVRDLLLAALQASDRKTFQLLAAEYVAERTKFLAQLAPDDRKYLSFQLWKEGIARYTEIKCAEAVADYRASSEFAALPDYEPFATYARHVRSDTLDELKKVDLAKWKRVAIYPWGAAEGMFLDRYDPKWKGGYFLSPFTLDPYFAASPAIAATTERVITVVN
jgi:hypothetical protein